MKKQIIASFSRKVLEYRYKNDLSFLMQNKNQVRQYCQLIQKKEKTSRVVHYTSEEITFKFLTSFYSFFFSFFFVVVVWYMIRKFNIKFKQPRINFNNDDELWIFIVYGSNLEYRLNISEFLNCSTYQPTPRTNTFMFCASVRTCKCSADERHD